MPILTSAAVAHFHKHRNLLSQFLFDHIINNNIMNGKGNIAQKETFFKSLPIAVIKVKQKLFSQFEEDNKTQRIMIVASE